MADIIQALVSILLFLDSLIYSLINWVYQIILILCQVDILNNTFEVQGLINRLYVIIGVVVLFVVAYSLLRSMVNPDDAIKGKKSPVTIIRDVLISIVAIALVPTIFSVASRFQNAILLENTIGKIILGDTINAGDVTYDSDETVRNGGMEIASNVLRAFLHPVYSECNLVGSEYDCSNVKVNTMGVGIPFIFSIPVVSDNYDDIWQEIYDSGNFLNITIFSYSIAHDGNITYYYLISTLVGAFVLLVLLSYCIDIAIRTIKLAVYQLIAPLPILARIAPGEQGSKIFSNWLKATISTYLEVFIRLAILFFAVLMVKLVVQNLPTLLIGGGFISGNAGFTVYLFAQLFLIVGIILFVKQAPGLIKEITGLDGGKYNVFGSAMRAAASIGALTTGTVRGFTNIADAKDPASIVRGLRNAVTGGAKSFMGAAQGEYKGLRDVRKNANESVNRVIDKQRRKESERLAKQEELRDYQERHPREADQPRILYQISSRAGQKAESTGKRIIDWATSGGLEALRQKRDQVASVQKAMADVWSIANKEVQSSHEKFYNEQGIRLDELQNNVEFYTAQLSSVKADEALTNRYSELQGQLINETDPLQQGIIRNQMARIKEQIDVDIDNKRKEANKKLQEAQEELREGEKWATQLVIDATAAEKNGQKIMINGVPWTVETVGGLSAQISKADNMLKQNASLMPEDLPTDEITIITNPDGTTDSVRKRKYKDYRNKIGNTVEQLDSDISAYVERQEKKKEN